MLHRFTTQNILESLARQGAVAIIGPRQVGKTTLALEIGEPLDAVYLDLESADDRNKLDNPTLYFESVKDRLVILDEIHRMPGIFETLRGIIDRGRREGKGIGRFLILGSASIDLLRQSSETLAGRISYIDLSPLIASEIDDSHTARERLWLRGGFPDSFLAANDKASFAFRKDFIRTYLERDVPMFGPRIPATTLERLWTMLAHRQGSLLNASELARSLDTSTQSVTRYIDLLCDLLLVRRLTPFLPNVGKRLIKSPKVYVRDSGLVHALLGITDLEKLAGHPVSGASWEGFALESLLAYLPWRRSAHFYRTSAGAELDLVIDFGGEKRWAVEIKRAASARVTKGFHEAIADIAPERAFVVHASDARYPLSETTEAIGVRELAQLLAQED
jgi:predicted AAA+ superfamily ATPase